MTSLDLILEAFKRNARVTEFLLDALTDEDLALSDGKGGMTVAHMLSHMAVSRGGWLVDMSPEYAASTKALVGEQSIWAWQTNDRAAIKAMFKTGDEAATQAVQAHLASGQPFADPWKVGTYPSSPAHFLLQNIVHDSHHRGQIIALLRQSGYGKEQLDKLEEHWDIWRE
ncbi:MAG: DinB family protein [Meiothermus sp.]|nr:DinB family protein [Meiothermus sp.]